MNGAQIVVILLALFGVLTNLHKDGQDKKEKYDFNTTLIANSIWIMILYWGGFWQ